MLRLTLTSVVIISDRSDPELTDTLIGAGQVATPRQGGHVALVELSVTLVDVCKGLLNIIAEGEPGQRHQ